jgi:hypothetical protein
LEVEKGIGSPDLRIGVKQLLAFSGNIGQLNSEIVAPGLFLILVTETKPREGLSEACVRAYKKNFENQGPQTKGGPNISAND